MPASRHCLWVLFAAIGLSVSPARAQKTDRGNDQPIAPTSPMAPDESSSRIERAHEDLPLAQSPAAAPDTSPVSGAQDLTTGAIRTSHSFLLPSFSLTTQADKNPRGFSASNSGTVRSLTYLLGRVNLVRTSGLSRLSVDYLSGATLSNSRNDGSSVIQGLHVADTFSWRRWSLLLGDQMDYLPDTPFGFGGVGGLSGFGAGGLGGLPGGTQPTFRPELLPSQTIPIARVSRISNTVVTQANYQLNARSSLTAFQSYGILRFLDANFLDSSQSTLQAGYNYQVNSAETLAVIYRFTAFRFPHQEQGIDDHIVRLSYARRVTGRLSAQISAGPEVVRGRRAAGANQRVSWNLSSAVNYQLPRISFGVNYDRSVTGGSGVLAGAETSQVQASVSRNLSRAWQGTLGLGYANNRALSQATGANVNGGARNNWFTSIRVSRRLGRGRDFFLAYSVRVEGTNNAGCAGLNCGQTALGHQISIGFHWAMRPVVLE